MLELAQKLTTVLANGEETKDVCVLEKAVYKDGSRTIELTADATDQWWHIHLFIEADGTVEFDIHEYTSNEDTDEDDCEYLNLPVILTKEDMALAMELKAKMMEEILAYGKEA